jgi:hypothetical protein
MNTYTKSGPISKHEHGLQVRFQVLTAASMKMTAVVWEVALCCVVEVSRCLRAAASHKTVVFMDYRCLEVNSTRIYLSSCRQFKVLHNEGTCIVKTVKLWRL